MRIVLIVHLLSAVCFTSQAVGIDKIKFINNRSFSSRELESFLSFPEKVDLPVDSIASRVYALPDSMLVRDFLNARVDSFRIDSSDNRTTLYIYIAEGNLFRIGRVQWQGEITAVPENVWPRMASVSGAVFRWHNLEEDIAYMLDAFEMGGYPFARIEVQDLTLHADSERVDLELRIASGPATRISFVQFTGQKSTKEDFLLKESRLRTGKLYDQRKVDAARRRLRRLEFIRDVKPGELVFNNAGESGVEFEIEEARLSRIDAVAGFQPGGEGESGTLTGLVDVELLNLFGGGRKGRVHWEHPSRNIQQIDLAYVEPWILGQPVSVRLDFSQRIQDTIYVTRFFGARLQTDITAVLSIWGAYRREAVITDSLSEIEFNLRGSETDYLETGLSIDTRDHPLNPRGGIFFSTFVGRGFRTTEQPPLGSSSRFFTQQRGGADSEIAHEIFPSWIAAIGLHARALDSDEPEILLPDLYRLGGARSLRGYREEQFLGSRIGWINIEARYWLGTASRIFVFEDVGAVYREQLINGIKQTETLTRAATGIGLRVETALGVWGVDYGVAQGDNPLQGKLHVSLQSSF